jgi:hypothetical protein
MEAYLIEACEEIDAAMFSGDSFMDEQNRKELMAYINRWVREVRRREKKNG